MIFLVVFRQTVEPIALFDANLTQLHPGEKAL